MKRIKSYFFRRIFRYPSCIPIANPHPNPIAEAFYDPYFGTFMEYKEFLSGVVWGTGHRDGWLKDNGFFSAVEPVGLLPAEKEEYNGQHGQNNS